MYDELQPSPKALKSWRKADFARKQEKRATKRGLPADFTTAQAQRRIDNLRRRYADLVMAQQDFVEEFGGPSKPLDEAMFSVRWEIGKLMAGIALGQWEGRRGTE